MSTTVTYKGSTLTTVNNNTKTLKTAGKYMEGDVVLSDESVDVSQDTVTADKLMQGYTAHDKTGTAIIGTANCVDIPIFNIEYDQNWELISASCTETYAQCYNRYNNNDTSAFYHQIWNDGSGGTEVYNCTLTLTMTLQNKIVYTGFITGHPSFDVVYNSDDTIEFVDPSSCALNLEVTSNGVYTPPEEYGAYTRVEVNVPTGGGSSNVIVGTFTTLSTSTAQTISIPYTGNGYPIMATIEVDGGVGAWLSNTFPNRIIGRHSISKQDWSSAPNYNGTTGILNVLHTARNGEIMNQYSNQGAMFAQNVDGGLNPYNNITFISKNEMKIWISAQDGTNYGLKPSTDYIYTIVYSS